MPRPSSSPRPAPHAPALVLEIRPGDGGQDAADFAAELAAALTGYAQRLDLAVTAAVTAGRTTTVLLTGAQATPARFDRFAGVHRIQRVPRSDPRGRRHTSTASVAVLPAAGGPVPDLDPAQVRVDTFRGTGPGGQHRNKTDSAVRAVHLPTGLVVTVTRGRSQHQNRAAALAELARRVQDRAAQAAAGDRDARRGAQIAGAAGAAAAHLGAPAPVEAKAFTYNAQRDEVLEHATGRRWPLARFLRGQLD